MLMFRLEERKQKFEKERSKSQNTSAQFYSDTNVLCTTFLHFFTMAIL